MSLEIILIGIIVGIANFASRFGPLFMIEKRRNRPSRHSPVWIGIALGAIGISAITAMLVVATLPPLIETPNKIVAMSVGFIVLSGLYYFSKKIVLATLLAALAYGLVYTYLPMSG
ncbi:branched-subunit amino acid transport protein AzlD [Acinetobacter calcoaceticus]|uniref:Branched-subunit amino acid transport protein AzlD n=1 Tax=Acinetobacter calcoaceticus TaxID=471 RepID=A0A4R1XBU9_ACICA|nr:branched-subunit amino acid transport protein AzlD [Acinetobacter calcoaceticus]